MNTDSKQMNRLRLLTSRGIVHNALIETKQAGYTFPPHVHDDCEFYIIKQGRCFMDLAGKRVECPCGHYILILPNVVHSLELDDRDSCSFYHVHFDLEFLVDPQFGVASLLNVDLSEYLRVFINFYLTAPAEESLQVCMRRILEENVRGETETFSLVNFYLLELLLLLAREVDSSQPAEPNQGNSYVNESIRYIERHYADKILLEDLAAHLNISVRYLSKVFYQKTGMTVLSYINTYRVNQAVLLMKTDLSLTDIAFLVGFSSLPHFSKVFHKIMAAAPKDYRRYLLENAHRTSGERQGDI